MLSETVHSKWLKICPYTHDEMPHNTLGLGTAEPDPCPSLDLRKLSRMISDDVDILSYDELKKEYSSVDWNEYFTSNQWQLMLSSDSDVSGRKTNVDVGFGCGTISQLDRSEPDNPPEGGGDISNVNSQSMRSAGPSRKRKRIEFKLTAEPFTFTSRSDPKLSDIFRYRCVCCPQLFMIPRLVAERARETECCVRVPHC